MGPHEFIIFCWLPFEPPEGTGDKTQQLIEKLRREGWPFRLRCKLPANPSDLFPTKFAYHQAGREGGSEGLRLGRKAVTEEDLSTMDPMDFLSDEEDESLPEDWPSLFEEDELKEAD